MKISFFTSAFLAVVLILSFIIVAAVSAIPKTNPVDIRIVDQFTLVKKSSAIGSNSALYFINYSAPIGAGSSSRKIFSSLAGESTTTPPGYNPQMTTQPDYVNAPYLLKLKGNRTQIGWDYADLLAEESAFSYTAFLTKTIGTNQTEIDALEKFLDWLWDDFYSLHTPQPFLDELNGMAIWAQQNPSRAAALNILPRDVSRRFYCLANMPADAVNIISALEQTLEKGLPQWLKDIINIIIKILESLGHHCDAFAIFGSRTQNGRLYSSRNLDFNPNTGIDKYKLIISYELTDGTSRTKYVSIGFAVGLGALAGMSEKSAGISVSEMNLDNSNVDFRGLPFPLRLRWLLEGCTNLQQCMTIWNSTHNTNSFNFLIGSGTSDKQAYALETMWNYTGVFPADSPVEAAATYPCGYPPNYDKTCDGWVWNPQNKYGNVKIGFPLPDAVWRTNHGMNPEIMKTQEPLFNGTVFRYRIAHNVIDGYGQAGALFHDLDAVNLVATLGTKGSDFFTCDYASFPNGDNILSAVYKPGDGEVIVAWERGGTDVGGEWRPAACSPYIKINVTSIWDL